MFKNKIFPNLLFLLSFNIVFSSVKSQINNASFATKVDFNVGVNTSTGLGVIADLNNDNKPEVLYAYNSSSTTGQIAIFTNTSTQGLINSSSFAPVVTLPALNNVLQLDASDLDGDGKADIVSAPYVANNTATSFSVYRNTSIGGSISFGAPNNISISSYMAPLKLKDFDGDGKPDLAAGFWYLGELRIYRNISTIGNIAFDMVSPLIITVGSNPISLSCNDFSGDGKTDIAVCNYTSNSIMVFRNTSTVGTISFFTTSTTISTGSLPSRISAEDIDNDTKIDLLVSNYNSGNIGVYKNTSSSNNISFSTATTFTSLSNPLQLACSDFDDDGKKDVIVGYESSSNISLWRNFGSSLTIDANTFNNRKEFTSGGTITESYLADLDRDNKTDIVVLNRSNASISVFKNQTIPSNGLIAYYPFSGNALDSSGFENHGTVNAGVTLTSDRKGNTNKAYSFNGNTNSYISIPSSVSTNTSNMNNFSISVWFNPTGVSTIMRRIINIQDNALRNYDLAFDFTTNKLVFINWNGTSASNSFYSKMVFNTNNWSHIVLRIDSLNRTELFVNGILDTFATNPVVKPVNPIVSIGRNLTNNWNFQGSIDEVRLYNRYLTNSEIQSLAFDQPNYTDYYSKSSGDLNLLSTWGTNTNGSGTAPLSFDSSYCRYFVMNNNAPTISNNWNINGAKSVIILGDSINTLNFTVPVNRIVNCDSLFLRNGSTLSVFGSLTVNGVASASASTVQFLGSSSQNISKGVYHNLTVNASIKNLLGNVTVANNLNLFNHINCNSYLLTLGSSANQTGTLVRSTGNVIGNFARWYSTSTTSGNNGLFPIGLSNNLYYPIQVNFTTAPTTGGVVTAQFFNGNPGTIGMPLFDGIQYLDMVGKNGYWRLTTSNGISGGTSSVSCLANGFWGITDFTTLRLVKRSTGGAWVLSGNAGTNTGTNSAPEIIRTGVTSLTGEYGIAGELAINPLPVKLISFSAIRVKEGVDLNWKTAEEINNAGFEIEKSDNGSDFITLGFVEGNKNSSTVKNYFFKDENALTNEESYYRLKQIDFDAKYSYSNVIKLSSLDEFVNDFKVTPNPFKDYLHIQLNTDGVTQIQLFDFKGKEVLRKDQFNVTNEDNLSVEDLNALPSGLYVLKITMNNQSRSIKLIKE